MTVLTEAVAPGMVMLCTPSWVPSESLLTPILPVPGNVTLLLPVPPVPAVALGGGKLMRVPSLPLSLIVTFWPPVSVAVPPPVGILVTGAGGV